jgi:hypothetical protein
MQRREQICLTIPCPIFFVENEPFKKNDLQQK